MDKRRFLKAIGMTSVASLLTAPFFARSSASSAFAQEGASGKEQFAVLQKQISSLKEKLEKEIRDREELSNSFVGSVVAIPYASLSDVPRGWHLCDGTAIPETPEYAKLRALGLKSFPDYRGVFLRGLDEGVGKDPGREVNTFQDSANKKHSHGEKSETVKAGAHNHGTLTGVWDGKKLNPDGGHSLGDPMKGAVGGLKIAIHTGRKDSTTTGMDKDYYEVEPNIKTVFPIQVAPHHHRIQDDPGHTHGIPVEGENESRPQNVSVRYIIKYA